MDDGARTCGLPDEWTKHPRGAAVGTPDDIDVWIGLDIGKAEHFADARAASRFRRSSVRKQRHTARRIWERLVDERGATVAEPTVRAYVGHVRRELESGSAVVTIPQLHPPGEEAEVDFGRVSVWLDGVLTELSMFVMRLSHSGRAVHICFPGEGQKAFLEGHVLAFERLGGVPRRIRYDNLK